MSIADKLEAVADVVYEKGKQAQYDEFWDTLQANGASKSYQYAFGGRLWSDATFKPKYALNGTSFFRCFAESAIKTIEKTIDLTKVTGSTSMQNMFNNADIVKISEFLVSEDTTFHNTAFNGCTALVTLNMTGTIGKNNLSLIACTKLSEASILSILRACNKENSNVTITLPANKESVINGNSELLEELTRATNETYKYKIAYS